MDGLASIVYSPEWRENVLKSAMTGYMRVLSKVDRGEVTRNRKGVDSLKMRRFNKLLGIREWYKVEREAPDAWEVTEPWERQGSKNHKRVNRTKDSQYVESVFFVPPHARWSSEEHPNKTGRVIEVPNKV